MTGTDFLLARNIVLLCDT